MSRQTTGFTLVELLITVSVLAVVIALGIPAAGDWLKNSQIKTATESILDGLQKARSEAVRRNAPVAFVLDGSFNSAWNVQTAVGNQSIETRPAGEGSSKVTITTVPANATTVTFDGMGRRWGDPTTGKNLDAGKSAQVTRICVNLPSTFLDHARTRNLEIDISLAGQVRMCDPQIADSTDNRYCPDYPTQCKD